MREPKIQLMFRSVLSGITIAHTLSPRLMLRRDRLGTRDRSNGLVLDESRKRDAFGPDIGVKARAPATEPLRRCAWSSPYFKSVARSDTEASIHLLRPGQLPDQVQAAVIPFPCPRFHRNQDGCRCTASIPQRQWFCSPLSSNRKGLPRTSASG